MGQHNSHHPIHVEDIHSPHMPEVHASCAGGKSMCVIAGGKILSVKKATTSLQELSDAQGIDWRTKGDVPAALNQGSCGSSDLFAAMNLVEASHAIASGKLEKLSMQQVKDCNKNSQGVDQNGCHAAGWGSSLSYMAKAGLMRESDYHSTDGKCAYDASKVAVTIKKTGSVKHMSEEALEQALTHGPVMVALEADTKIFQGYTGGVLNTDQCGTSVDHMVLAVGWKVTPDGQKYYVVENSWGKYWGDNGYINIAA